MSIKDKLEWRIWKAKTKLKRHYDEHELTYQMVGWTVASLALSLGLGIAIQKGLFKWYIKYLTRMGVVIR